MEIMIKKALEESRVIAVVGLSERAERPSYQVAKYLSNSGYQVIPVNPHLDSFHGVPAYPDLSSIPQKVDMVDVFRKSESVMPVAEEAVKVGVKFFWMQEGVRNYEAEKLLESHGIGVAMDKCIKKEHMKWIKNP
jgi:predicted CoA-binding protein